MTIVRVETDEGVTGIGSGDTMDGFEAFQHLFIGRDPLAIARHVRALETIDFHAGRYWPLEVALWDLMGKVAGLPVATLFGGASDGIPAYASCGMLLPPSARAESALALRAEGFGALKIRVDPTRLDDGLAAVEATRHAVGSSMAIMVDLNQGWRMAGDTRPALDPAAARRITARLAECDVLWVEEPLAGTDLRGLASLRAAGTGTRIAGGEMTRTFAEFAGRARRGRVRCLPARRGPRRRHAPRADRGRARPGTEPLVHAAYLDQRHRPAGEPPVAAGVGGGPFIEVPYDPPGWTPERRDAMLATPIRPDADGVLRVPQTPGLGIELDEAAIARYAA